jgi:glycerol-3-phosphate dehydrogenase (NAD(P)+)
VKAVVVGGGSWGTAFARVLADGGHRVTLACRDAEQARAIERTGWNPRYVTGVDVSDVSASPIDAAPLGEADVVAVAVPSRAFAEVVAALPGTSPLLILTKGLDPGTGEMLSTLIDRRPVAVLSGPHIAVEVGARRPTAAVVASTDWDLAVSLQRAINSRFFRVYVKPDVRGVELCGAAKNVIALAAGALDGLALGDNAKATLVTRGLAEMSWLGEACGARRETFAGLAGMGDLIVTCSSPHGRNRQAGELIARGTPAREVAATIGMVVEGLPTAPLLRDLAHRLGVRVPITEAVCRVLEGESRVEAEIEGLMAREPAPEFPWDVDALEPNPPETAP